MSEPPRPAAADRPAFRLRSAGVDYVTPTGTATGIRDVTIDIPHAAMTVLAGPSGSGKSTLLRVLGLVEPLTAGSVEFDGTDVDRIDARMRRTLLRRRLGLVFQNPVDNLLPALSVGENLRAAAESAGQDCVPEEILAELGLDGTTSWRIGVLSGGQQQRLAFGCVLARRTDIVLADEPTSQLDKASAESVIAVVRDLERRGLTVVVTSHDPALIAVGSPVVRLHDGVVETGAQTTVAAVETVEEVPSDDTR
ncbi:ABC transporter ATP-binding protein [Prauserella rugosa]|uniref:Putative ABC transport system ATP-binding protein n=1 Tax=Prauserella rugosa TaxID=43354 RepID=A0A660CE97_9PSEU|nr:ATP-binding cassette domain-containing protein [Prauserella rugosa]KMS89564.1 ABC transporter ATP-binding protein [Streptomyces regensis]TWH19271.1 putative ABC transport system ATP-binding protein [Prauserella rugosa]